MGGKRIQDVVLVTCEKFPELTGDDRLFAEELAARGLRVAPGVWDEDGFGWDQTGLCLLRSTWDYSTRLEEFLRWAGKVSSISQLWNPLEVIRWNTRKTYLRDLTERGVSVVPTLYLEKGAGADLAGVMEEQGWADAVVKPVVSLSARETIRVSALPPAEAQSHLDRVVGQEDVMVQPYLNSVETEGELSLMFIEGEITHAVRKRPVAGDFRVQDEYGGTEEAVEPSSEERDVAEAALRTAGFETLYARADVIKGNDGRVCLVELELVEPSLFFDKSPHAVTKLANAIEARL